MHPAYKQRDEPPGMGTRRQWPRPRR